VRQSTQLCQLASPRKLQKIPHQDKAREIKCCTAGFKDILLWADRLSFRIRAKQKNPKATRAKRNPRAAKGEASSTIILPLMNADDQRITNKNGKARIMQ